MASTRKQQWRKGVNQGNTIMSWWNLYTTRGFRIKLLHWFYRFIYFKGRNFRGKKLSRFRKTAKYLHFAGINFRGWRLMKNFAWINFSGEPLSKDFPGIKKGENVNLWEETFVFIVLWLRWDTWHMLKSLKKSFKKLVFHYSFFLEFLIFEILRMQQ